MKPSFLRSRFSVEVRGAVRGFYNICRGCGWVCVLLVYYLPRYSIYI